LADIVPDISPERVMLMFIEILDPPSVTTAKMWKLVAFAVADLTCLPSAAASGGGPAEADTPTGDEPDVVAVPEPPPLQPATSNTAATTADPADHRKAFMDVSPRLSQPGIAAHSWRTPLVGRSSPITIVPA